MSINYVMQDTHSARHTAATSPACLLQPCRALQGPASSSNWEQAQSPSSSKAYSVVAASRPTGSCNFMTCVCATPQALLQASLCMQDPPRGHCIHKGPSRVGTQAFQVSCKILFEASAYRVMHENIKHMLSSNCLNMMQAPPSICLDIWPLRCGPRSEDSPMLAPQPSRVTIRISI